MPYKGFYKPIGYKNGYGDFKFRERAHLLFGITRTNVHFYRTVPSILYHIIT